MSEFSGSKLEVDESGFLDVGDGHRIYWELSGNPAGKPAVVLHGGPGTGSSAAHRSFFDPDRYRVLIFDQRGCGRSTPYAGDPATDLRTNTTWHLVADIERLRIHHRVDRWLVLGGSWGSALALVYAQTHPDRVSELVLTGVCALSRQESAWYWGGGAGWLYPEAWERFVAALPGSTRDYPATVEEYGRLLEDPDPAIHLPAAAAWNQWDDETVSMQPMAPPSRFGPCADYAAARISNHYVRHDSWVPDGQVLERASELRAVPGVLVQGRFDVQTPARTAWELAQAWPAAELVIVQAGHSARVPEIAAALVRATDSFAG